MGDYLGATICVTEVFLLIVLTLVKKLNEGWDFFSYLISEGYDVVVGKMTLKEMLKNERRLFLFFFVVVVVGLKQCPGPVRDIKMNRNHVLSKN